MEVHPICLFTKQKYENPYFFEPKAATFTLLIGPDSALRSCTKRVCSLFPHGSPSNIWGWWSWTSDLCTVFQLKYSSSVTLNLPTHSPLPFSAPITQTSSSPCQSPTVPQPCTWAAFQKVCATVLCYVCVQCHHCFCVSLRNKQNHCQLISDMTSIIKHTSFSEVLKCEKKEYFRISEI